MVFKVAVDGTGIDSLALARAVKQIALVLAPLDGVEVSEVPDARGRPRGAVQELLIVAVGTGAAYHALLYARNVARRLGIVVSFDLEHADSDVERAAARDVLRQLARGSGSDT